MRLNKVRTSSRKMRLKPQFPKKIKKTDLVPYKRSLPLKKKISAEK